MGGGRDYVCDLLRNVHEDLPLPSGVTVAEYIKGDYLYYHYGCDGFDDRGWGCGYRTLMSLCSWIRGQIAPTQGYSNIAPVPSNREVQKILFNLRDKEFDFKNSMQWIGTVEVSHVIDDLYQIPCKLIHVSASEGLASSTQTIFDHFKCIGSPIMMGGDNDNSSKGIVGICKSNRETFLLVVDPHFWGEARDKSVLYENNMVKWQAISEFDSTSFYNILLPQLQVVSYHKTEET